MPSLTPTAATSGARVRRRLILLLLLVLLAAGLVSLWLHRFGKPEDFDRMESQFKYGSIGADHPMAQAPIPYWIWKVLPDVIPPETTLSAERSPHNGRKGLEAFGLISESKAGLSAAQLKDLPNFDRPIGFSRRRVFGMDFVGMNCAFCHLSTYKDSEQGPRRLVLGGTGNAVDIEKYFLYLFSSLTDRRFNADLVMPAIDKELARQGAELGWVQRFIYRDLLIPLLPIYLRHMEVDKFDFIIPNNPTTLPEFGPGRVDTWALYKRTFAIPRGGNGTPGITDFTSLWNQKARAGMQLHWDGNTNVLVERNVVSALSLIGENIEYLDFERMSRVTDWIENLLPPSYIDRYPQALSDTSGKAIDANLLERGAQVFNQQCSRCHAAGGDRIGRVELLADLGTDPERLKDFTPALRDGLNRLGTDKWQLRHFELQAGYVNAPLDGIWMRAPYLHNGSVPTMRDLLAKPENRPKQFCRGNEVYDWQNLGFLSAPVMDNGRATCPNTFLYKTDSPGNGNGGHFWGTDLSDADKDALMELLKTL